MTAELDPAPAPIRVKIGALSSCSNLYFYGFTAVVSVWDTQEIIAAFLKREDAQRFVDFSDYEDGDASSDVSDLSKLHADDPIL